ncbi:hypothetical protein KJ656_06335, partial [bacterium]|nr:hypothetical protein [bacterium]
ELHVNVSSIISIYLWLPKWQVIFSHPFRRAAMELEKEKDSPLKIIQICIFFIQGKITSPDLPGLF